MNISELTGLALDWAVAKCERYEVSVLTVEEQRARWFEHVDPKRLTEAQWDFDEYIAPTLKPKLSVIDESGYKRAPTHQEARTLYGAGAPAFSYTTSWAQSGPIIDREFLGVFPSESVSGAWCCRPRERDYPRFPIMYGPTPLIAAMRCYVASKLGDEIEIPKELA